MALILATMDLATYRKEQGISQADFAALLTDPPATQGLISQWESGKVKVPAERVGQIEKATAGAVTRHDLRPDVFGPAPTDQARAA